MSISAFDRAAVEAEVAELLEQIRPPVEMRNQLDFLARIEKQSVVLLEKRPYWRNPKEFTEREFAKATFQNKTQDWSVYWMRASGKWELYPPHETAKSLKEWFQVVSEDDNGCFFG